MCMTFVHFHLSPQRRQLWKELKGQHGIPPQWTREEPASPRLVKLFTREKNLHMANSAGLTSITQLGRKESSLSGPKARSGCWEQEGDQDRGEEVHGVVVQDGLPCYVLGLPGWAADHQPGAFIQTWDGRRRMVWETQVTVRKSKQALVSRGDNLCRSLSALYNDMGDDWYGVIFKTLGYQRPSCTGGLYSTSAVVSHISGVPLGMEGLASQWSL